MAKLNDKQKRFCQEYIKDFNGKRAAISAGYSKKTARSIANENLTKPDIQTYLEKLKAPITKKLEIDTEWVLKKSIQITDRCMQEEVVKDSEGNPTGEYRFDSTGANKALDRIGRYTGGFNERIDIKDVDPKPTVLVIKDTKTKKALDKVVGA